MKRLSILTFWGVPNYGAYAQAYALNKVLKNVYNSYDVKHIAYLHPAHYNLYYRKPKPKLLSIKSLLSLNYYKKLIKYYINPNIEYQNFTNDWNMIDHIDINSQNELEKSHFDIVVTGSDAIWEYSVSGFGDDIHLIGNNLNCNRLLSYAASFGDMKPSDDFAPWVASGLNNYDKISVRDQNSKEIVDKFVKGKPVDIVLDPTLLWNFKNDPFIPQLNYNKYILVYGNDFSKKIIDAVVHYAKKNDLLIIGAGLVPEWCDLKLTDIGPLEWIGMFKNAEFVVTCTFHGLMFSINYEKKVIFNQVEYVKNRSTTLLKELGLYDLYNNELSFDKIMNYKWNYNEINKKLDILRNDSYNFIKGIDKYE